MNKSYYTVLLVEDNPADIILLREALSDDTLAVYSLAAVESLREAMSSLREQRFDAVLLDLGLPDSQGLSTYQHLHQAFPEAPVLVLSALADETLAMQALQAGAQDYLVKQPQDYRFAARAIRYAVERQSSELRFAKIFHASPTPQLVSNLESGRILDVNEAYARMVGYSREEMIGRTTLELGLWRGTEDRARIAQAIKSNGRVQDVEIKIYSRTGEAHTVLGSAELIEWHGEASILSSNLDITARKQAEEQLRESEERFSTAFYTNPVAQSILSAQDSEILAVNDACCRLFGYSREELMGVGTAGLKLWEHPAERQAALEELHKTGRLLARETNVRTHIGELRTVIATIEPIVWQGKPCFITSTLDISERKQNEKLLRQWADAFTNCAHGIAIGLPETNRILTCNPAFARLQGRTIEEISSMPILSMYLPEEWETVRAKIAEADRTGSSRYEVHMLRKDGTRYPVQMDVVSVRDETGAILYRVATQQDITERKQAHEEAEQLLERLNLATRAAGLGIWDWDVVQNRVFWDDQLYRLYGREKTEETLPATFWLSCIHPEDRERCDAMTQQALREETEYGLEFRAIWPDGSVHWLQEMAQVIRDAQGAPLRMVGVNFDISEIRQAQRILEENNQALEKRVEERTAALSQANAELLHANRIKDEFLSTMSHELRTPLTGILGLSEALRSQVYGEFSARQLDVIGHIENSGQHLLSLINDILDVSKLEAGKLELQIAPFSLYEICLASINLVKGMAAQKNQHITLEFHPMPIWMLGDGRRLKQVVVNLLSNAVKFTQAGGSIQVEVAGDEEQRRVMIAVSDTGMGIKAEDLPKLFQPFVQLDGSLARQQTGTGLGLTLVRRLVELHGGTVTVTSEYGQGSRFTVDLSWKAVEWPAENPGARSAPANAGDLAETISPTAGAPAGPLVLLVDDNETNLSTIADYLAAKSFRVVTARDGHDFFQQVAGLRPNVILMDIQMPGIDGLTAIRMLRADPNAEIARIPVIAVTALVMPGDREKCLAAGANEYLQKPVRLSRLADLIRGLCAQPG